MTLKIIGTGLARTGTMSLRDALEVLTGEPCYHMYELFLKPERLHLWEEAEENRQIDWDSVYSGYGSAVGLPTTRYYAQLLDQYPEATFIHTERDAESWYESAVDTIFSPTPPVIKELRTVFESLDSETKSGRLRALRFASRSVREGLFQGRSMDRDGAIRVYNEHNKKVLATIPSGKLLLFRVEDGWQPLCDFLDVDVPQEAFPHRNKRNTFAESMERLCYMS